MRRFTLVIGLAAVATIHAGLRDAAAFTQVAGAYVCRDSEEPGGPVFTWDDIATSGTPVPLYSYAFSAPVSIGFPFAFAGNTYTSVIVYPAGYMTFGSTVQYGSYSPPLPSPAQPNYAVYPLFDLFGYGYYYYLNLRSQVIGTAPNRRFVVTWISPAYPMRTFQAALHEATGRIRFQYQTITGFTYALVGIEGSGMPGTANQYLYGLTPASNALYAGLAVEFAPIVPVALTQCDGPSGAAQPAGWTDDDGDVTFRATLPAGVQFQVEVKPLGTPFDGTGTQSATAGAGPTELAWTGLVPGDYRWRARGTSGTSSSPWVEFAAAAGPHFTIAPPRGPVSERSRTHALCGGSASSGANVLVLALALALVALIFDL